MEIFRTNPEVGIDEAMFVGMNDPLQALDASFDDPNIPVAKLGSRPPRSRDRR